MTLTPEEKKSEINIITMLCELYFSIIISTLIYFLIVMNPDPAVSYRFVFAFTVLNKVMNNARSRIIKNDISGLIS